MNKFSGRKRNQTQKNKTEKSTRLTTVFMDAYLGEKLKTKNKNKNPGSYCHKNLVKSECGNGRG